MGVHLVNAGDERVEIEPGTVIWECRPLVMIGDQDMGLVYGAGEHDYSPYLVTKRL